MLWLVRTSPMLSLLRSSIGTIGRVEIPGCSISILPGRRATDNRSSDSSVSFAQLIHQARLSEEEALVALYQRALPVIYRYVLARLGRADLAEDVVSEVFLVMVETISALRTDEEAGFYAWLLRIARGKVSRALRQLARQSRRQVPLLDQFGTESPSLSEPLATNRESDPLGLQEWRETLEEVGEALGKLSADQQVIVVGRFLGGQTIEELAQVLGKQPGAVRVAQYRALRALAHHLEQGQSTKQSDKGGRR